MDRAFEMTIGPDIGNIPAVSARLEEAMEACGFGTDDILDTQLAVEEVITNVIVHGYKSARGEIHIACRVNGNCAEVEIADTAPPFDPLSLPEPDLGGGINDRKIGGLGVFLVRQVMDVVRYRRIRDRNILTVSKKKKP